MNARFERTGEVRAPRKDEWFWGMGGFCLQASCDMEEPYPILRMTSLDRWRVIVTQADGAAA